MSQSIFEMTEEEFLMAQEKARRSHKGWLVAFGVLFILYVIGTVSTLAFIAS